MAHQIEGFRLAYLPKAARVVLTMFVLTAGLGYLTALTHLFNTYSGADRWKEPPTPERIKKHLAGDPNNSILQSKITGSGSMKDYVESEADRTALLDWVHSGASQSTFGTVEPIFKKSCITCHNPSGAAKFRAFTDFKQVQFVAQVDKGESFEAWARIAHIHMLPLATFLLVLGLAFAFTGLGEGMKSVVIVIGFLSLIADFGVRSLIPRIPDMVYVIMAGGMGMAFSTVLMMVFCLYDLLLYKPSREGTLTDHRRHKS